MKNPGIYILTSPTGKSYVGKDVNIPNRINMHLAGKTPRCKGIHNAIKKYGADNFRVEIILYPGISEDALYEVERWKISQFGTYKNGYNMSQGGKGFDSELCRQNALRRVTEGTNPFAGELGSRMSKENARKRIEDGTHHWAGERGSENNRRLIKEGRHPFGGERGSKQSREVQLSRVADGTHNFVGEQGSKMSRENALQRVKDGTNPFAGEEGRELARKTQRKRIKDGTHHFSNKEHQSKAGKAGAEVRWRRWRKSRWMYIRSLAMLFYESNN